MFNDQLPSNRRSTLVRVCSRVSDSLPSKGHTPNNINVMMIVTSLVLTKIIYTTENFIEAQFTSSTAEENLLHMTQIFSMHVVHFTAMLE